MDGWTDEQAQTNLPVTGEGARVSDFFSQRIGGKGAGGGGLGLVIFFHKESKSKKKIGGGG